MPSSYVSDRVINDQTENSRPIIVGYVSSGHYFEGHKNQTKQPCTAFHFHKVPAPSDHESSDHESSARPSTAAILASYKLRFSPPIVSQIDCALWSSSIILSTSTVRKTSWERSIDERRGRGRGEPEGALTLVV
jgi:hypothetical protein